jgi:predicted dehydrogenase
MPHHVKDKVWLVGAGLMATEYAKVLKAQNVLFEVIGRGSRSATLFTEKTGVPVSVGGLKSWLDRSPELPEAAIVAVNVEELAETTLLLVNSGARHILVEKPAGLNLKEINQVAAEAEKQKARIYVAYNRRFYASTLKAQQIISEDGGVTSFTFEFTEWSNQVASLEKDPRVKENWFLANSTHVVDLAFYLGGFPEKMSCYKTGSLTWHPSASVFAGAGVTASGALFSYHANWEAPGRWSVEVLTRKHRLVFRPLEKLQIQTLDSLVFEDVRLENDLDVRFKPGLHLQVEAFLTGKNSEKLATIASHRELTEKVFLRIIEPK